MPYVKQEVRDYLDPKLVDIKEVLPHLGVGELNYIMTEVALAWLRRGYSYSSLLRAHGTFGMAAAEFYRRVVAPYEDGKIAESGDVYAVGRTD